MKNENEIFRDIVDYEGLYAVSNYGNVKGLRYGKEKLLKPTVNNCGYMVVGLCKDGKVKHHFVHRLVASAFIDNPEGLNEVNHIDEDKANNCTENLEWCTHEYNINHGTRNARIAEALKGIFNTKCSIPIDMLTKDGEFIRQFPSSMEAERYLRVNGYPKVAQTNIIQCCKGKLQSCYGFKWRYAQGN